MAEITTLLTAGHIPHSITPGYICEVNGVVITTLLQYAYSIKSFVLYSTIAIQKLKASNAVSIQFYQFGIRPTNPDYMALTTAML